MPSRFFDYESELFQSSLDKNKRKTGHRKSTDTAASSRHNSTSAPTSTTTTRSSCSSATGVLGSLNSHHHNRHDGQKPQGSHNMRDPYQENQVEPTPQIQEWAHQLHMQQRRRYWWCSSCYPKLEPLEIPKESSRRRVRIQEPTHAYE